MQVLYTRRKNLWFAFRNTAKTTDALNSHDNLKIAKGARVGKGKFTSKHSSCFQTKPDCITRQILDKFVFFFTLYTYKFCIPTSAGILSVQPILTKTTWLITFYFYYIDRQINGSLTLVVRLFVGWFVCWLVRLFVVLRETDKSEGTIVHERLA